MAGGDDCQLLRDFRAGDVQAFEFFYSRHWRAVVTLAGRRSGDANAAEDIAQESFHSLAIVAQKRDLARPRAYLGRVAINLCVGYIQMKRLAVVPLQESVTDPALEPMSAHVHREDREAVQSMLQKMPAKQRRALYLWAVEEHSYVEIGNALGLSARAVEGVVARARKRFRKDWNGGL